MLCLVAAPAFADDAATGPALDAELEYGEAYRATTLLGTEIHITSDSLPENRAAMIETDAAWEEVGEIGDMLIGVDGALEAVVIDVGGFLGVGEKEVAVPWSALRPVHAGGDMQNWFLGIATTRAELEAAPELEREPAG
jgi:hypothetical protein